MRVLFLTHRLPYAPNRGDRIRAYHVLEVLRGQADVELISLVHDGEEASHVEELQSLVDAVHLAPVGGLRNSLSAAYNLTTTAPLTHAFLDSSAIQPMLERVVF